MKVTLLVTLPMEAPKKMDLDTFEVRVAGGEKLVANWETSTVRVEVPDEEMKQRMKHAKSLVSIELEDAYFHQCNTGQKRAGRTFLVPQFQRAEELHYSFSIESDEPVDYRGWSIYSILDFPRGRELFVLNDNVRLWDGDLMYRANVLK